jgi:hypothetical protein
MTDSAFGRLLGALVSPVETFRSIAARPTWLVPLLLLAVLGTAVGSMLVQHLDFDQLMRVQNERTGGQMTGEQVEHAVEQAKKWAPIAALLQGVIVAPAIYLLLALVFWAGFRLLGSDLTFKTSLATSVHALLPSAIAALLSIPVILRHGVYTQQEIKGGNFLASSLAFLVPGDGSPALRSLLGSLDLFSLWTLGLLVVGYRETARVSPKAAFGTVLTLWLIYVVGKVALAALLPG